MYHCTGRLGIQQCTLQDFVTLILSGGNGAMCWHAVLPPFWKNLLSQSSGWHNMVKPGWGNTANWKDTGHPQTWIRKGEWNLPEKHSFDFCKIALTFLKTSENYESSTLKINSKLVLIFVPRRFMPGLYLMSRNHPNPTGLQAAPPPKWVKAGSVLTATTVTREWSLCAPLKSLYNAED
jgi:hypothetical protein